jgi:hypothetical protein
VCEPEKETADLCAALRSGPNKKQKCNCNKTKKKSQCPFYSLWVGFAGEELMNKPERVHTGEQIHFPHLAKMSEIWGTHSCGWVRVLRPVPSSLNLASAKSFARDDKVVTELEMVFHRKKAIA